MPSYRDIPVQIGRALREHYELPFASVVAVQANDTKVEVGLIGREGMSGLTIVLGNHRSPHSTYMQAAGRGQRIGTVQFRKAMQASASLHGILLKYVQAFMIQTAHTAISNARSSSSSAWHAGS
jgi:hypothetical protein